MTAKSSTTKSTTKKKTTRKTEATSSGGKLVIVESPAKARTVSKMLGGSYKVKASVGHVRDLPQKRLGVDIKEKTFTPKYEIPKEKREVVNELREAARSASAVYLATDPDREGEAISWHLVEAAKLSEMPIKRVVFHELTSDAIHEAFKHPRDIDMDLVSAQQARRILDRLVGYKLSPLLCQKIRRGLSAGRVQSVALKLVVNRERDIQNFVPQEYWSIDAKLEKAATKERFTAAFIGNIDGKKIAISSQKEASKIVDDLRDADYKVAGIKRKDVLRQPSPPFTTSTLQQEAWRKLRFSAQRTMSVAQQLYEGLPLGKEGLAGLITYMRTDSTRVAPSAIEEAREYVKDKYGAEFLPKRPRTFTKKAKGAQEAHEAIRPTSIMRDPASIKAHLTRDQHRLYDLIWKRMVSSQMAPAVIDTTAIDIEAAPRKTATIYLLRASSSAMKFQGFTILYSEGRDEADDEGDKAPLPEFAKGDPLKLIDLSPEQHFTQPPARYTQATLIKSLEEWGIGRPSTYAPILAVIQDRDYIVQENGRFRPTELGMTVSDMLSEHFPDIVDFGFTAQMEEGLDLIAQGEKAWVPFLENFYEPFEGALNTAKERMVKVPDEPTDEICDKCGSPMVIKNGRFGKFIACSGYPDCKNTKPVKTEEAADEPTEETCPSCGNPMVMKTGRFGKFIACANYPKCKTSKPVLNKIGVECPKCGQDIVERKSRKKRTFYGCSAYPDCDFTSNARPVAHPCPQCQGLMVMRGKDSVKCTQCAFITAIDNIDKTEREAVTT
ncbi:MAG: type I DNA topoisomerase [Chloroflexota bacterium]|nr:type I DNA topoisomerase [Chloroflexota bacterium]